MENLNQEKKQNAAVKFTLILEEFVNKYLATATVETV